jgi:uncharacterized damage-inducible protein DinB
MYRKIKDFSIDWKYESESTIKIFNNITDSALNKKDHENVRSIAILTWHITTTIGEMLGRTGVKIESPDEHSKPPASIKEIIDAYTKAAESCSMQIEQNWNDDILNEKVEMYGEEWKKGVVLDVLIKHQTHHRGQLTVLMRQAGLKVPGIYGPAKEEWAEMNMPAAE